MLAIRKSVLVLLLLVVNASSIVCSQDDISRYLDEDTSLYFAINKPAQIVEWLDSLLADNPEQFGLLANYLSGEPFPLLEQEVVQNLTENAVAIKSQLAAVEGMGLVVHKWDSSQFLFSVVIKIRDGSEDDVFSESLLRAGQSLMSFNFRSALCANDSETAAVLELV